MGLWGAAQAAAFGLGGLLGTAASDLAHALLGEQSTAYAAVFGVQALMFALSAAVALRLRARAVSNTPAPAASGAVHFQSPKWLKGGSSS